MKSIFTIIVAGLFVVALLVSPFGTQGLTQEGASPFAALTLIFNNLASAVGIGLAITFLIQLGKMYAPQWFPDASAQNWRLGAILIITLAAFFIPMIWPQTMQFFAITNLDQLARDFAEFGTLLMPLFVLVSDWASKKFYSSILRGSFLGKSYSLK